MTEEKLTFNLGDELIINTNELQDEKVRVVDLTSDGIPFCVGVNFEGWVPILRKKDE